MRHVVAGDFFANFAYAFIAMEYDLKSACQGPQKFEHRDIERKTRYGKPDPGFTTEGLIHPRKEAQDIAVFDHYTFWLTRGAGGIDDICEVSARGRRMD